MSAELTQFTKEANPRRVGLVPVTEPLAERPTGVRLYAADLEALADHPDRSGFIREAVRKALQSTTN
jgi:hypothetical protein